MAPSPNLSQHSDSHSGHLHSHRRWHLDAMNEHAKQQLSAAIPLPKSHIHRTPSELQLVDDTRRAEFENVRMYARLVVGMRSQCLTTGRVHPLTWKSLLDIQRAKQVEEAEASQALPSQARDEADDGEQDQDQDWRLSYYIEEDGEEAPRRAPAMVDAPAEGSSVSNLSGSGWQDPEDENDDCMFSLEL